ncbi:colony stimulating factor 3 (granulocyte) b [Hoplias malabaricus]|uniref:colony stimulating factor 3 (granulocyte) b n=1 Tax=Hoplias malabaricus TaxID=27720 RepID=UPI003461F343
MMNQLYNVFLLCCLLAVSLSAPVPFTPEVSQHLEHGKSLTNKLLSEIPTVHLSCVNNQALSLDPSGEVKNLAYITAQLSIPPAPQLVPISESVETSLSRISEGLQLHQGLLQELREKLKCSETLSSLLADIRDLSSQVSKIQQLAGFPSSETPSSSSSLSSRLTGDYEVQVATHRVLQQLRSFGQDAFRVLRHIHTQGARKH